VFGSPAAQVAVLRIDWQRWHAALPAGQQPPLLAYLRADASGNGAGNVRPLREKMRLADRRERRELLESYLREQAAGKLGLAPSRLDTEQPLNQLGVDSLIAVELRTQIQRDLGTVVPVVQLLEGPSVAGLAEWLSDRLSVDAAPPGAASTEPTVALPAATEPTGSAATGSATAIDLLTRVPELSDDAVEELLRHVLGGEEGWR
jgi:phthiocerol/phenolphthiocerol synthesis type-I polyketide synthase C